MKRSKLVLDFVGIALAAVVVIAVLLAVFGPMTVRA